MSTYSLQSHLIREEYLTPLSYTVMQFGFLVPFVIPLILLSLFMDIDTLFPQDAAWSGIVFTLLSLLSFNHIVHLLSCGPSLFLAMRYDPGR